MRICVDLSGFGLIRRNFDCFFVGSGSGLCVCGVYGSSWAELG